MTIPRPATTAPTAQCQAAYALGDYLACLDILRSAKPTPANDLLRARCHYRQGHYQAAIDTLRSTLGYCTQHTIIRMQAMALLALCHQLTGEADAADAVLAQLAIRDAELAEPEIGEAICDVALL